MNIPRRVAALDSEATRGGVAPVSPPLRRPRYASAAPKVDLGRIKRRAPERRPFGVPGLAQQVLALELVRGWHPLALLVLVE
eukprot:scaffold8005_cov118-Isochrysis_galbana.AAC.15